MASFSDSPLEIIAEIIDALQDDIAALEACSQTCSLLLPLCRKYIFRSIHISARSYPQRSRPRLIKLFGILLKNNPGISDLVRNFVFRMCSPDLEDDEVPWVLGRLHHLQSFELGIGDPTTIEWNALRQPLRDVLLRLIQLPSLSRLRISYIYDFPITVFFPCMNLADLTLTCITKPTMAVRYEEDISAPEAAPQLQSFAFRRDRGSYTMYLLNARRPNGVPVLDFSKVRTLTVEADREQDLVAIHALIRATKQLETLKYTTDITQGYTGFAASMNASSLSTLRTLRLQHDIEDDIQDPLCGICEELSIISGRNVIEEIFLDVVVQTDCQCKTGSEWGGLDAVLSRGFPKLRTVSLDVEICVFAPSSPQAALQEQVNEIPRKYFPWLSSNVQVTFKFSSDVYWV
ncbi:uncharacterized protein LACBIDRAFT_306978 [Laccaria bicolor S238N-H82]|uniref:Predicted protein n=1 Tax=Laccaria bicolor (strain S238N-H82 / ATCC MYA-4686) TaxID=486041 RepID=B0DP33_LACBS|nr:uncharacterized protein LACBIDRAFT_306978 [Laccaria bicolor S238N-H82]EDR03617.1 predicted protein [Laccaria bicolor S238N-H82]|eukprot:XP_001885765.1 predicted protein [Laccaria bicolor S238N-H82]